MAQKSRPDPSNGTVVTADEYEALGLSYCDDGIYGTPSDTPVVYADATGRRVKVRAGKLGIVRGYEWFSDAVTDEIIDNGGTGLPANTSGNPRIDRLVLRLDRTARTVRTQYLQGTPAPAGTQQPPALTQSTSISSGQFDFPLARWNVASGYTTVAAADLTIEHWYPKPSGIILCTSTSRPFGASLYVGMKIYETDTKLPRQWDGTDWRLTSPYRDVKTVTATTPSVTFSNIPQTLRRIVITGTARANNAAINCDAMCQINGISTVSYRIGRHGTQNGTAFSLSDLNQTAAQLGTVAGNSAAAGVFGEFEATIDGWDSPHANYLTIGGRGGFLDVGGYVVVNCTSAFSGAGPYNSITVLPVSPAQWLAGSEFVLTGCE